MGDLKITRNIEYTRGKVKGKWSFETIKIRFWISNAASPLEIK